MYSKACLILCATLGLATPVQADFLETTWLVKKFTGEPWFLEPSDFIGQSQFFFKGYAEGVFYSCNYDGQSQTYTTYGLREFFKVPDFETFKLVQKEITNGSQKVFVHRITCARPNGSPQPYVLYPFVTTDTRNQAWYLLEGGIFSLQSQEQ